MPAGLDIAYALAAGLTGLAMLRVASMQMTAKIITMRPKGPGRTRAS